MGIVPRSFLAQRIPPGIGLWLAVAGPVIQVGAALETESLAVLPAFHEGRRREKPFFAYCWSYIELVCAGIVTEYVRVIIGRWIVGRGKEEMCILTHRLRNLGEAFSAIQLYGTGQPAAEVEAAVSGTGKPPFDVDPVQRAGICRSPDGIVGREVAFDLRGR